MKASPEHIKKLIRLHKIILNELRKGNLAILDNNNKVFPGIEITIDVIYTICSEVTGQVHRKTRKRGVVQMRQLVFFFAKKYTCMSLSEIGLYFNQDHATVLHGIKTINDLIETDAQIRLYVTKIDDKLKIFKKFFKLI